MFRNNILFVRRLFTICTNLHSHFVRIFFFFRSFSINTTIVQNSIGKCPEMSEFKVENIVVLNQFQELVIRCLIKSNKSQKLNAL